MKKLISILLLLFFIVTSAQNDKVGINTTTPSAMLDIVSKGNTDTTKALEINNSSAKELLNVTDQGNVGINIGSSAPSTLLHINSEGIKNIRHENLPALVAPSFTPPFNPLGVTPEGNGVGIATTVKYLYYQNGNSYPSTYNLTNNSGGFSLYDTNEYINLPIVNDSGLKGNSIGMTFGADATATVNGQTVNNVNYIIIPEPGVYLFEFYGTARCNRYNNTQNYTLNGQIQVNTLFTSATGTGTSYTTDTIFRGQLQAMRLDDGSTYNGSYGLANPQTLTVAFQTTEVNQKVALFFQYVSGETNQFTHDECLFNVPAGANFSYYFIVTKM